MTDDSTWLSKMPERIHREIECHRTEPSDVTRLLRAQDLAYDNVTSGPAWANFGRMAIKAGLRGPGFQATMHALAVEPGLVQQLGSRLSGAKALMEALRSLADIAAMTDCGAALDALQRLHRRHPMCVPVAFRYAVAIAKVDPGKASRTAHIVLEHCPTLYGAFTPLMLRLLANDPAVATVRAAAHRMAVAQRSDKLARRPASDDDPCVGRTIGGHTVSTILTKSNAVVLYRATNEFGMLVTLCRHLLHEPAYAESLFRDMVTADLSLRYVSRATGMVTDHNHAPLLVMNHAHGHLAQDRLHGVPLGLGAALNLTEMTARVIDELYRRHDYVHGAIGPDYLMLVDDLDDVDDRHGSGYQWPILLIDAGIQARRQRRAPGPLHLAPEPDGPSHLSDVFGLGTLLYWCVTGRLPDPSKLEDPRVPNDPIGRAVKQVLARCLAPDPAARFRTAGEVADAVDAIASARSHA